MMERAPNPVIDALITSFADEAAGLDRLAATATAQLEILRTGERERFEDASLATADAVADLDRLGQVRARKQRLLARTVGADEISSIDALAEWLPDDAAQRLREARDRVRSAATVADARCDALAFALHYAVELGRDTLTAWQGLETPRPARVYTAGGLATSSVRGRTLLNQTG